MTQQTQDGQGETPPSDDAPEYGLSSKSGKFGRELAWDILADPRLSKLTPRALGVFFLIKAHEEGLFPLSAVPKESATKVNLTAKAFEDVIGELVRQPNSLLKIPLIEIVNGTLRALPFGKPIARALQDARSKAADKRWEKVTEAQMAEAAAAAEAAEKAKPTKAKKQKKTEGSITQVSLFAAEEAPPTDGKAQEDLSPPAPKVEPTPYEEIHSFFLKHCPSLPTIKPPREWLEARRKLLRDRWKVMPSREAWIQLYERVEKSDFLTGRRTEFRASFDWIINQRNFQKICDGNFDNVKKNGRQPLFNNGADRFQVGSYGDHDIDTGASWMNDPVPPLPGMPT